MSRVRLVESDPSIIKRMGVIKSANVALHIGLAMVRFVQGLVMAPNYLNFLGAECGVKTLMGAFQIHGEVPGQNSDNLIG